MADKENGFILGFFEEFLEEYMQSNSTLLYQNAIAGG